MVIQKLFRFYNCKSEKLILIFTEKSRNYEEKAFEIQQKICKNSFKDFTKYLLNCVDWRTHFFLNDVNNDLIKNLLFSFLHHTGLLLKHGIPAKFYALSRAIETLAQGPLNQKPIFRPHFFVFPPIICKKWTKI
ncbi:hypothetical protein BpHYR1_043411 [Brachionus plicatilis]|uniref:Uncharacterized protein n=1 Tax=Brachionus plicatilis TaxID=10195 RepID=A0A3M7SNE6_BRAPC|nr:hypothetical protein BpHYR1_043411 [Brachionus plicatilis]